MSMTECSTDIGATRRYNFLIPVLHGQLISVLISGTGFFASLLADRNANCPMFLSLLTYTLLSFHLCWLKEQPPATSNGYVDLDDNNTDTDALIIRSDQGENPSRIAPSRSNSPEASPLSAEAGHKSYQLQCPWYLYFFLALLDVEANVIIISAYNYTSITSIMLLDCFSIPCVMLLSFCFLGARYRSQHTAGVVICLLGMGCIILSDTSDDTGPSAGDDGDDDGNHSSNAIKGDILCLIGTALYALSNVLQEAMVKTEDRIEYLGMLGLCGTVISVVQTSIFERHKLLHEVEWDLVTGLFTVGFVLCLFFMYRNTSSFLTTSDAALFNLSLLTSDVYAVVFSYFVFGYTMSWLYFVALVLSVTGVVLYHCAGPVTDNVEAAVEKFRNVMQRGMQSYADHRDRFKFIHTRKDSDVSRSFRSIHDMDNYDCIVDEWTGSITNSMIVVDDLVLSTGAVHDDENNHHRNSTS